MLELIHAFPKETPAARVPFVVKKMMFAILHHVPIPMGFVKKVRTVVPVPQIVSAVPAVDPVMPASKANATTAVTQRKKARIARTVRPRLAGAVVTACAKELKMVTIAQ